jgi:hypothetical protein
MISIVFPAFLLPSSVLMGILSRTSNYHLNDNNNVIVQTAGATSGVLSPPPTVVGQPDYRTMLAIL